MGWIVWSIIILIGTLLAPYVVDAVRGRVRGRRTDRPALPPAAGDEAQRPVRRNYYIGGALVWALATLIAVSHIIQAGEVGIVYQFGSIVGQRSAGYQLTWPWQSVTTQ